MESVGDTVIVFDVAVEMNTKWYEVRCATALSRAIRNADSVVLYAFVTRCAFNIGCRLMNEIDATTIMIAITIVISSKLKPLVRYLRCRALIPKLFMSSGRYQWLAPVDVVCNF